MIAKEYTKMSKVCPACGKKIDANALFCTNCGFSMAAKAEEAVQNTVDEVKTQLEAADDAAMKEVRELEAAIEEARKAESPIFTAAPALDNKTAADAEKLAKEEEKARQAAAKEAEKAAKEAEKAQAAAAKEAEKAAKEAEKAEKAAARKAEKDAKKAAKANITAPVEEVKSFKSVGTAGYFFLMLLFALPIIGWLSCIIIALAAKNPSLKNFARAVLVWLVVGLIVLILLTMGALFFGQKILTAINAGLGTNLSGLDDLVKALYEGSISLKSVIGLFFA